MQKAVQYTLEQLDQVVSAVYEDIIPGSILTLHGLLGAGKTTFVQKLLHKYGVKDSVLSPTYSYVSVYETPQLLVYHFDLYRISGIEEFQALGFLDYLRSSRALICIEWPERISSLLEREMYVDRVIPITFNYVMEHEEMREVRWIIRPPVVSVNELLGDE
jgi:tRNA threonylcarbamoyladenosine biosynthesis protein TsaE